MADWPWIESIVNTLRAFGAAEAYGFDELPDSARVTTAIKSRYAPHPHCDVYVDDAKREWVLDHGRPLLPFRPSIFLIAGVHPLGFVTGVLRTGNRGRPSTESSTLSTSTGL